MSKVLIIDDHLEIAKAVQKDLSQCNSELFRDENTFCLEEKDDIFKCVPIIKAKNSPHFGDGTVYINYLKVIRGILLFIQAHPKEHILVLIDEFLRADHKEPVLGKPYDQTIDCLTAYIYSGLLMYINGKTSYGSDIYPPVNLETLYTIIYSHNSRFHKCSEALYNIFARLPQEDIRYFPREACKPENISLVEGGASDFIENASIPLPQPLVTNSYSKIILPQGYKDFIKSL